MSGTGKLVEGGGIERPIGGDPDDHAFVGNILLKGIGIVSRFLGIDKCFFDALFFAGVPDDLTFSFTITTKKTAIFRTGPGVVVDGPEAGEITCP